MLVPSFLVTLRVNQLVTTMPVLITFIPQTATMPLFTALGVHDFVKRIQYTQYDKAAVNKAKHDITTLAYAEGLQAHAKAIEVRNDNN